MTALLIVGFVALFVDAWLRNIRAGTYRKRIGRALCHLTMAIDEIAKRQDPDEDLRHALKRAVVQAEAEIMKL